MSSPELRQRAGKPEDKHTSSDAKVKAIVAKEDTGISLLDILRVLAGLLLLNVTLSYFITNDSFFWGNRPSWTRPAKAVAIVTQYLKGPIQLTDAELLKYDGSDPDLPIYLAVNGTIFDVSAGRDYYGPGGSYHGLAGHDATRAYVTGCFGEDISPDLRGAEEMYMPLEDEEADAKSGITKAEKKIRRQTELKEAMKKVRAGVEHWEGFFMGGKGGKYFKVGTMKREDGWLEKLPRKTLCEQAQKSRKKRKTAS